jgi:hypothetical protein
MFFTSTASLITKNAELFGSVMNFQTLGIALADESSWFCRTLRLVLKVKLSSSKERWVPIEDVPE